MEGKSKLGISVSFFAFLAYISGLASMFVPAIFMLYAMHFEENEELRFNILQAFSIVILFTIASGLLSILDNIFGVINMLIIDHIQSLLDSLFDLSRDNFLLTFQLELPLNLDIILRRLLNIIEAALLLYAGIFGALKNKTVKLPIVSKWVEKAV